MSWAGGKSANSVPQGPWICSLIPWEYDTLYCEPYGAVGGVMLQRKPTKQEYLNDLDQNVINWWRQVRNKPEELGRLLDLTPHSEAEYYEAVRVILENEPVSDIERAMYFTIAIYQSIAKSFAYKAWSCQFGLVKKSETMFAKIGRWSERIEALAERMKSVELSCRPAVDLLNSLAKNEKAVIYCDPPYPTAFDFYGNAELDVDELSEVLLKQKGRVAISGYEEEWDHLGWYRHECPYINGTTVSNAGSRSGNPRREILWTNYVVEEKEPSLFDIQGGYSDEKEK